MPKKAVTSFVKQRQQYRGRDYLCCTLTYHLSPVMETHRPAVMLSLGNDRRRLSTLWEENKYVFFPSGKLYFYELMKTGKHVLVLFYHIQHLARIIKEENIRSFLKGYGYVEQMTLPEALKQLEKRFRQGGCPPEVGAFLGIPLDDIKGFIAHRGKNYKACGSWKVYSDLQQAGIIFSRSEEAKTRFVNFINLGYPPGDYLRIHSS